MTKFVAPGLHLLIDFWEAKDLQDMALVQNTLKEAAAACDATVMEIKLHSFGEESGITGVAILAESHISIHTWPELNYIALDVFMCGNCDPYKAIPVFETAFKPKRSKITAHKRGAVE